MADTLSGAPEAPSVNPLDSIIPGSGNFASTLKPIDPNAKLKLAARDQAADPFAGLEPVTSSDPFSGLEEVKTADAFSGLQAADDLDLKDTQTLVDDDNFRPADYLASNPNIRTDAEKSKKLIDVYRARQVRGLEAGKVLKAAATEAPGIVSNTVKGIRDLGARVIESTIQPAATSALATLTGATAEEKAAIMAEQGKEQLKAAGEVTAGTEAALTGLTQLGQQGFRKLFGKAPEKMTDSELLDQLYLDAEFSKTTKEVAEGRGDVTKAAGLDADTLAKNGVTLDKEAIEHLSLVDPLTLVATAGVFKVVGMGGKVIATAASRAGAQAVITGLARVAQTVGAKTIQATGQAIEATGKVGADLATRLPAKSVGFVLGAGKTGTLQGGAVGAAAGEAAKRIAVETSGSLAKRGGQIAEIGTQLNPSFVGPRSAGMTRLIGLPSTTAGQIATRAAGGALQGAVTAAPLAAAADDSQTAGALLGGGLALGAIHGTASGTKTAIAETVAKNYLDPHNIPFPDTNSPAYGLDANLDATHDASIAKLPQNEQNAINTFRESVRAGGGEIYVQDGAEYFNRIRENLQAENGGKPLTPEQEAQAKLYADTHAFFDGYLTDPKGESRRVVFLNGDSAGLHHDAGHLFQSMLSPENQASLRESALSSYSKDQLQAFKDEYAKRIGEPDYFDKLGDQADVKAADELIAENFSQLFQNQTFENLSAPRSFLKKLADTAVQAGEALGFDLTAGRTTADLGATPSFRLQDLLRNAAQDVLTRKDSGKLTPAKPTPAPAAPAAPVTPAAVTPATPTPVVPVTPAAVTPAAPAPVIPTTPAAVTPKPSVPLSTEKNIRAERTEQSDFASRRAEETGIAEAQKATESNPEVRQVVDTIAESMNQGNPVLEVEHRGIVSDRGPASPEGRTSRRGTQESGYAELDRLQIENRAEAPADIVDLHQKTFVPVRFTTQGGKPTLIAMSLDKVIANVRRVVKDAVANKAESLLPYPVENGKLTDAGWKQAIADVQAYSENQSNGYRGDGQKLTRPTEDIGVSLPAENPNYTPKTISEGAMNFANLVQGLNPPETGRVQKGLTPGNVKGQLLAEVNKKQPMTPAVIKPENVTKQKFKGFEPRTVKETNPLRNELAARGVKVRELTEVTERLAVEDIASVKPRADINFKAPVTDVIRAGFLPKDRPVAETISSVEGSTPDEWSKSFGPQNSLTREAYEVGLKLKSPEELTALRDAQNRASDLFKTAMEKFKAGDMDAMAEAYAQGSKGQFFREAYEAATDTGSAAGTYGWRKAFPEGKPPFAENKAPAPANARLEAMRPERLFLPASEIKDGLDPIKRAAIRTQGGSIYEGSWHGEAYTNFSDAIARGESTEKLPAGFTSLTDLLDAVMEGKDAPIGFVEDGFVTESGKFLNRAQALDHAEKIGQMKASTDRNEVSAAGVLESNEFESRRDFLPKGDKPIRDLASEYAKTAKIPYRPHETYAPVDTKLGEKLADFYDSAKSDPTDPAVQKSYQALADETLAQYQAMTDAGYKIEPFKGDGEPYKNSDEAIADIRDNKHLYFLKTEGNFDGQGDNPMLADSGIAIDGEPLVVNDVFRAVHDFFGHGKEGYQFGPRGEFNAWRAHSEMFSPEAQGALAAETLAQNSWVNFGKQVRGKEVALKDRPFAEQKAVIVPDELIQEAKSGETGEMKFLPSEDPRAVSRAAVEDADGRIYSGSYHGSAIDNAIRMRAAKIEGYSDPSWDVPFKVGFVTNEGKFLSREEAFTRGKELGQLPGNLDPVEDVVHTRQFKDAGAFLPKKKAPVVTDDLQSAAIKLKSGRIVPGYQHFSILEELARAGEDTAGHEQGFVTDSGKFLDREQAYRHGVRIGQLPEDVSPGESLDAYNFNDYRNFLPKKRKVEASDVRKRETTEERMAREIGDTDFSKYNMPEDAPKAGPATGWILPNQKFVPLDANFHEQFLAQNADTLNKDFKTKFSSSPNVEERLNALNSGFVRVRYTPNDGTMRVELSSDNWNARTKRAVLEQVESQLDNIDRLHVSLLNRKGGEVDSISERVAELDGPEKFSALSTAIGSLRGGSAKFLPSEEGTLPGMKLPSAEKVQQNRIKARVVTAKDKFPEALPPEYAKDENGKFITDFNGKPKPLLSEYRFADTPVAREAAKGIRGPEAREEAVTDAIAEKLVKAAKVAQKNPEIQAGSTWYSTARTRLKKLLGNDAKFFSELLGATSARTPVETNFRFSLDAYNQFKRGAYDELLKKYREGKNRWVSGEIGDYVKATGDAEPTRAAYMDWWVQENDLTPMQSNGKKFAMNSQSVLKVLDGSWATDVQGPKTPNFAGNLSGQTFEATIDVWASRLIHRLANEGNEKPWRILPENETGLSDADFFLGQSIFRKAAEKLGMKPDALQAILWFAEKDHWEKNGWTRGAGAEKSDFNSLLKETEMSPEGVLKRKTPQGEFMLSEDDIKPKKR